MRPLHHPYLEDDGEEDDDDGGADKQVLLFDLVLVQEDHQGVSHSSSKAAVGHDHLVYDLQLHHPVPIQNPGLQDDPCGVRMHSALGGDAAPLSLPAPPAAAVGEESHWEAASSHERASEQEAPL